MRVRINPGELPLSLLPTQETMQIVSICIGGRDLLKQVLLLLGAKEPQHKLRCL